MKDEDLRVLFSSETDQHSTPQEFFDKLNEEFQFTLDVCASKTDAKCEKFFTKEDDALKQDWVGTCFMNPPYGREIIKWMKKAWEEHQKHGSTIVCLIPARTDTNWWHSYVDGKAEFRFVKGRLKFGGAANSAPFPSVVIIYRKKDVAVIDRDFETKAKEFLETVKSLKTEPDEEDINLSVAAENYVLMKHKTDDAKAKLLDIAKKIKKENV